jgi:hypothetical protein
MAWLHTFWQWRARALAGASINTLTLASESAARRLAAGGLWESARVKVKEGWNQAGLMPVRA